MAKSSTDRGRLLLDAIEDDVAHELNPSGDECWHCGGDGDGKCACDYIVDNLIGRIVLIDEEDAGRAEAGKLNTGKTDQ